MDVSDRVDSNGPELIQTLVTLTAGQELSEQWVRGELDKMIENAGHSDDTLTLEQLRHAVIAYLEMLEEEESRLLDGAEGAEALASVTAVEATAVPGFVTSFSE